MEREALRKINLIFGERIMKDGNAGNGVEFAGGNMPVIAHGGNMPVIAHSGNMPVIAHGGNMPVIAHGGNMPVIAHSGNMPVIAHGGNMPVMVADHLEVQPLGHVVSGDTVSDL